MMYYLYLLENKVEHHIIYMSSVLNIIPCIVIFKLKPFTFFFFFFSRVSTRKSTEIPPFDEIRYYRDIKLMKI